MQHDTHTVSSAIHVVQTLEVKATETLGEV